MLRLPMPGEEAPRLVVAGRETSHASEVAPELADEELEEAGLVKKRRRSARPKEEIFDETFAEKKEVSPKMVKALIGTLMVIGTVVIGALLWPSERSTVQVAGGSGPETPAEPERDRMEVEAEREVVRPKLVEDELLPVFLEFLNAEDVDAMGRWVRHPEVTLPRMREFYGDEFVADGFSSILWGRPPVRVGEAIKSQIQDGDYGKRVIFAVNEDGWKIDWESWVGWSESDWKSFKAARPTEPVMFRVVVSDVSYFNFKFTSESEWSSYRLESPDGNHLVFGYVPRAGELDTRLKSYDGTEDRPFTLRLRFPEGATTDNQVIVDGIVAEGWFDPGEES